MSLKSASSSRLIPYFRSGLHKLRVRVTVMFPALAPIHSSRLPEICYDGSLQAFAAYVCFTNI